MNRAPWTIVLAFVLVLGIGIGAVAGGVHTPAAHGNRASASPNSPLTPAVCSYPTVDNVAAYGGAPASGSFTTTAGDLLVAYVSIAAYGGVPNTPAISDGGTDTWTQGPVSSVTGGAHNHASSYFTATAAASGAQAFTLPGVSEWSVLVIYELAPSGGDSLSFGTIANESGTGSLSISATNGICALGMTLAADDYNNPTPGTTFTPPVGWTVDAGASYGGGSIASTAASTTIASSGTESATFTGGAHVGDGVMITYGQVPPPPATAPTNLVLTPISSSEIDLAWTNPSGESLIASTVYEFAGATVCSGAPSATYSFAVAASSFADTNLTLGTSNSFEVAVSNATGYGPNSSCETARTLGPPTAPTGLTVSAISTTELDLAWVQSPGTVTDSHVYQSLGAGCSSPTPIDLGTPLVFYAATGLAPATVFSFTVTASNASGESVNSTCVENATLPDAPNFVVASTEPLSPPFNYGETLIDLTWSPPSGTLVGQNVSVFASDCSTPVAGPYPETAGATGATIGSLVAGQSYCFEVSASTLGGVGLLSTPTSASINTTLPLAPTAVLVTAFSTSLFSIAWTDPSGNLTGFYTAEAFAPNDCGGVVLFTVTGSLANPYSWGIVSAGDSACVEVAANTSGGMGPFSTPTSTSINATLPDPVTGATNATVSSSEINLAWTNPGGNLTVVVIVTYAGGSCGGSPLTVSSLGVTTSYHATGLNGSTTYSFAVIPYTSGGAGSFSCLSNSTFAPPPPPLPPPPSPTGILVGLLLLALVLLTFLAFADSRRKETR